MRLLLRLLLLGVLTLPECSAPLPAAASTAGIASWYGRAHAGRPMANGQPFDPHALTCATWVWPLGTRLRVSHGDRAVVVTVTDRGPARRLGRIIDLSHAAFAALAPPDRGLIAVEIRSVSDGR